MREYVGHLLQGTLGNWDKETVAVVTATSKQEALRAFLDQYPSSDKDEWNIYGGESEAYQGIVREIVVISGWEA